MGGGARYPYPKHVWTPSGGWWTNPSNWMMNTAICTVGALAVTYVTWNYSADREQRHNPPRKPIPSMLWARQFKSGEMKIEPDP
ncbi:hypothetical protein FRB94_010323 [Tulasnella sp. JGI-2019a]|nr:hypothetical protein FRB94_010323 [Tulasnella sp. JGI-2019a]KAG8997483.1 hypothetical protein FRB93_014094 [Tulasnella sp. JGI-2019a]KAG9021946.1 hypothetical protein FRB95_001090 [Tulasnella sp. JGI-2019a]